MIERTLKIHKLHNTDEKDASVKEVEARLKAKLQLARHENASVVGLAVDTLNKTLVSVGSDSKLILCSCTTHAPHSKSPIHLPTPATKLVHARDSDLLAIALEDYSIVLFDYNSLSVVRKCGLPGNKSRHTGPISDIAFGPDSRKLFSSSLDGTLRVWDVPTNTCIDWMTFSSPPTSLTLSTTGEFLATAHQGKLGISLWCDRSFFQTVHLDGANPPTTPFQMDEPAAIAEEEDKLSIASRAEEDKAAMQSALLSNEKMNDDEASDEVRQIILPKKAGLVTLSGLPAAHWKNLFHLELVKERNKPTEAPKKAPEAPFFLQWRGGESNKLPTGDNANDTEKTGETDGKANDDDKWEAAWSDDDGDEQTMDGPEGSVDEDHSGKRKDQKDISDHHNLKAKGNDQMKRQKVTHFRSELASILETCSSTKNFESVTEYLATKGPSAIDVEFSTLCHGMHDLGEGLRHLHLCSMWLLEACKSRRNYEVINAYLHRFLHIHATTIAGIDTSAHHAKTSSAQEADDVPKDDEDSARMRMDLLDTIKELRVAHREATDGLRNKMQETLCLLRHFSRMI